jgi:hypothetical protein
VIAVRGGARNGADANGLEEPSARSAATQQEVRIASDAARHPPSEQAYGAEKHHEPASTLYDLIELELGARDVSLLPLVVRRLEELCLDVRTA